MAVDRDEYEENVAVGRAAVEKERDRREARLRQMASIIAAGVEASQTWPETPLRASQFLPEPRDVAERAMEIALAIEALAFEEAHDDKVEPGSRPS